MRSPAEENNEDLEDPYEPKVYDPENEEDEPLTYLSCDTGKLILHIRRKARADVEAQAAAGLLSSSSDDSMTEFLKEVEAEDDAGDLEPASVSTAAKRARAQSVATEGA
jgi:hypothetical protein